MSSRLYQVMNVDVRYICCYAAIVEDCCQRERKSAISDGLRLYAAYMLLQMQVIFPFPHVFLHYTCYAPICRRHALI